MLDIFIESKLPEEIKRAPLDSREVECLLVMFEILGEIYKHFPLYNVFKRSTIAIMK